MLPEGLASELRRYEQNKTAALEAGGTLVGLRRGPHFEVTHLTTPQRDDIRGRTSFVRRARSHMRIIIERWRRGAHQVGYLGEWHTHPETMPRPSTIDMAGWRRLSAQHKLPLIHLIVGTGAIGCWYCNKQGRISLMTMLSEGQT